MSVYLEYIINTLSQLISYVGRIYLCVKINFVSVDYNEGISSILLQYGYWAA